jgi:hypothetical protein
MTNGANFGTPLPRFDPDPMRVWQNDGNGSMTEISASAGMADDGPGRGLLTFDYDRDGDLDLFVVNNAGNPVLYRNDSGNQNSWLRVDTVGTDSNRDGIGAIVSVWTVNAGDPQVREIHSGSQFLGQSEAIAHFGLGAGSADIDRVTVYWPATGRTNDLSAITRNQTLVIVEPIAIPVDGDDDNDGILNSNDSCTQIPNSGTNSCDTDMDGYGNPCDGDFDNSGAVTSNDFFFQFLPDFLAGSDSGTGSDMDCGSTINAADFELQFMPQFFDGLPGPSGLACAGTVTCP